MATFDPGAFAAEWLDAWNTHDLDRLMGHYAEDVVFTSPFGERVVPGSGGVFRGKDALRAYWARGLALLPDLHFEIVTLFAGVHSVVVEYRNQNGGIVAEVLLFGADGLIHEGHGNYPTD